MAQEEGPTTEHLVLMFITYEDSNTNQFYACVRLLYEGDPFPVYECYELDGEDHVLLQLSSMFPSALFPHATWILGQATTQSKYDTKLVAAINLGCHEAPPSIPALRRPVWLPLTSIGSEVVLEDLWFLSSLQHNHMLSAVGIPPLLAPADPMPVPVDTMYYDKNLRKHAQA